MFTQDELSLILKFLKSDANMPAYLSVPVGELTKHVDAELLKLQDQSNSNTAVSPDEISKSA